MGYPPFNLTTLQLVAPSSNMTKAEYKDAYGIDLDDVNIKAFKLVLFGGEKYAIDQIKEVEDGIEIYFNGRIMSITDIVQVSDEVYDVANSKPIYCHPITIDDDNSANKVHISLLIFDNVPTEYNTYAKFEAKIEEIFGLNPLAVFPVTGALYYDSGSALHIAQRIGNDENLGPQIYTIRPDGTQGNFTLSLYAQNCTFYDGVNKIN